MPHQVLTTPVLAEVLDSYHTAEQLDAISSGFLQVCQDWSAQPKEGASHTAVQAADAEYSAWLFELMTPEPTIAELERMYAGEGLTLPQVGVGSSNKCSMMLQADAGLP